MTPLLNAHVTPMKSLVHPSETYFLLVGESANSGNKTPELSWICRSLVRTAWPRFEPIACALPTVRCRHHDSNIVLTVRRYRVTLPSVVRQRAGATREGTNPWPCPLRK